MVQGDFYYNAAVTCFVFLHPCCPSSETQKMKGKQSGCCSISRAGKGKGVTAAYPDATVISGGTFINACNKQLPQQPKE